MARNEYHFITNWRMQSTQQEIYELLGNGPDLVRWWPAVYLEVTEIKKGDTSGVGTEFDLFTKGWLPYRLRWQFTVTEAKPYERLTLEARGDFVGRGIWTFKQDGEW